MTSATTGFGVLLKRGDGGVGAGTQASRTISTSNQQIIFKARYAGTAGNSKTCAIIVSGNSTPYSQSVSATNVSVTSATDGGGLATTTVLQAIELLVQDTVFVDNWQVNKGAGNGSGILVAASSAALTGGTNGAEVFTTVAEVKSISGPNLRAGVTDVTNMDSASNTREFLSTLIDPGELTFQVNLLPANTQQTGLRTDLTNRTRRNFQLVLTSSPAVTIDFAGFVTGFDVTSQMEEALMAAVTIKVTSIPVWT